MTTQQPQSPRAEFEALTAEELVLEFKRLMLNANYAAWQCEGHAKWESLNTETARVWHNYERRALDIHSWLVKHIDRITFMDAALPADTAPVPIIAERVICIGFEADYARTGDPFPPFRDGEVVQVVNFVPKNEAYAVVIHKDYGTVQVPLKYLKIIAANTLPEHERRLFRCDGSED